MRKSFLESRTTIFLSVLILGFLLGFLQNSKNKISNDFINNTVENAKPFQLPFQPIFNQNNIVSEKEIIKFMKRLNIEHLDVALAQIKLETGNFTSNIFKENNNLFGMKMPRKRATLAIGENRNHAVYLNWKDSIIDYKFWQIVCAPKKSKREYISYLDKYYSEIKGEYSKRLKKFL